MKIRQLILDFINRDQARRKQEKLLRAAQHMLDVDDDLLSEADRADLTDLLEQQRDSSLDGKELSSNALNLWEERFQVLSKRFNPHPVWRETLDVLVVALVVAFGIRALFFQPFKIPTSSMQPTLYGIHYIDRERAQEAQGVSAYLGKFGSWSDYLLFSARKAYLEVPPPGARLDASVKTGKTAGFLADTILTIGKKQYRLPGTPSKVSEYTHLYQNQLVEGEVCDGYWSDGDHLFVNRLSLFFREPERGDVMVFSTENIVGPGGERPAQTGGYYIKRLVGMPGDTLKIADDTLWVKPKGEEAFRPIYEFSPVFEKLYSQQGGYQGHINNIPGVSHFLRHDQDLYVVPMRSYFMMGDNTLFSADSRVWGAVPRRNLIGRASVIFWPLSRRWGRVDHLEALKVPTGDPGVRTFESMNLQ